MVKYNLHKTNLRLLNETVYNSQNCLLIFFNMEITRRGIQRNVVVHNLSHGVLVAPVALKL